MKHFFTFQTFGDAMRNSKTTAKTTASATTTTKTQKPLHMFKANAAARKARNESPLGEKDISSSTQGAAVGFNKCNHFTPYDSEGAKIDRKVDGWASRVVKYLSGAYEIVVTGKADDRKYVLHTRVKETVEYEDGTKKREKVRGVKVRTFAGLGTIQECMGFADTHRGAWYEAPRNNQAVAAKAKAKATKATKATN